MKCVNENCNKDPFKDEMKMVLATNDGDFACCQTCLNKYEQQRDGYYFKKKPYVKTIHFDDNSNISIFI